jgi:hypothetical protein
MRRIDDPAEVQQFIDYVKDHTQNGDWLPLTIKSVQKDSGLSEYKSYMMIKDCQSGKFDSIIESKPYEGEDKRHLGRSILVRIRDIAPVKTENITSMKQKLSHSKYKNLTEDEVRIIQNKSKKAGCNDENVDRLLVITNVLVDLGARDNYIENYLSQLSDLLLISNGQLRMYVDLLHQLDIVSINEKKAVAITFGEEITQPAAPIPVGQSVAVPTQKIQSEVIVDEKPVVTTPPVEETETEVDNSEIYDVLVKNVESFYGYQESFKSFVGDVLNQIKMPQNTKRVQELESEVRVLNSRLTMGQSALDKCLETNNENKDRIKSLQDEAKKFKMAADIEHERNDKIFEYIAGRFEQVIAEISNMMADLVRMPQWQLNEKIKAKFQTDILKTITAANDDIVHYNNNFNNKDEE